MNSPSGILETCLYVNDLAEAKRFYTGVLGAEAFLEERGRHVFLRIGESLLFLFDPEASEQPTPPDQGLPIPTHGARGPGHLAFLIDEPLEDWRARLASHGVRLEREINWPNGARSLYFRDPAGNSLELASRDLWAAVLNKG